MISHVSNVPGCLSRATLFLLFTALMGALITRSAYAINFNDLESVLRQHPQIRAMAFESESNLALVKSGMALPDPVVAIGMNNVPVSTLSFDEYLPSHKAFGVRQRFPSQASRQAKSLVRRAHAAHFSEQQAQLFASMRGELIGLLHSRERVSAQRNLAQQRKAKYIQLLDFVASDVGAGGAPVFKLAKIDSEQLDVSRALANLNAEEAQINARLVYLLGHAPDVNAPAVVPLVWSGRLGDFYASRVAVTALSINKGETQLAKSKWRPEWGAQVTYQQREAGPHFAGDDWVSAMVTFTVPFWAKQSQAPTLLAAKSRQRASQLRLNSAERQAVAEYEHYVQAYTLALKHAEILNKNIHAVSAEISARRRAYESGAHDYSSVLEGDIMILKLHSDVAFEVARAAKIAAKINALMVMK